MNHATDLLLIGGTLLLALAAHGIGQRIHVPRVTLLLLLGALALVNGGFFPLHQE